jgi:asparagine synthase (glutamine-hydrolysing)
MCGICGAYSLSGEPVTKPEIARMIAALNHRGPDGTGMYVTGPIGLAHTRLSIIDLAGGAQPMSNDTGEIRLIFNGEIYNYLELNRSDLGLTDKSTLSCS